jgi:hypothetical protein
VARSGDAGRSFAPAVFALDDSTSFLFTDGIRRPACNATGGPLFDYPKLAADRSAGSPHRGALYLVALAQGFDRDNDGVCDGAAYVFIRSTDGGVTWEEARALDGMRLHTNHVAVGPDGAIYVAQAVDGNGPGGRRPGIWILKSVDGGATFLSPVPAYESADLEPAATWMAADPADPARVFVAFEGRDQEEIGHVYVQRSMDGGSTWGTPVRVDDSGGEDGDGEALRPTIAVAEGGRVDIAWFDYRRSRPARLVDNRQIGDVYFATSPDGAAWSRSLRLSGASAPLIFAPGNAFLTLVAAPERTLAVYAQDTDADNLYETWLAEIRPR